jgi:hypothetical protein
VQPTKVNTGASFNLLQSQSLLRWAQLRCTSGRWLAKPFLPVGYHPFLESVPGRLPAEWHEQGDRRAREGTERKISNMHYSPSTLPSILFILSLSRTAGWSTICQNPPRSLWPAEPALQMENRARCFSQLFPIRKSGHLLAS